MQVSNSEQEAKLLVAGVTTLLEHRIAEATEAVVADAVKAFEARLRREIALASLDVSNFYELDTSRGVVSIRVKLS